MENNKLDFKKELLGLKLVGISRNKYQVGHVDFKLDLNLTKEQIEIIKNTCSDHFGDDCKIDISKSVLINVYVEDTVKIKFDKDRNFDIFNKPLNMYPTAVNKKD